MQARRRRVIMFAAAVLAPAFATRANAARRKASIGVLGNENSPPWDGFRRGLRELGYVEGENIAVEWRWSEGRTERLPALAAELVAARVDLIVASSTPAIRAAMQATQAIPIVMANSAYPDKTGLVASLARPGGNVTGLTNVGPELTGKSFQVLKEIAPAVVRVAALFNPDNLAERLGYQEVESTAGRSGLVVQPVPVRALDDYADAFASIRAARAEALFAAGNPGNFKKRREIADFARANRLPSLFQERLFVQSGGLVSYAPSYLEMYARAASFVDRILKGAKAGDLPVEQPTRFELVINVATANAIGLRVPEGLLVRADEVIQ